jgi:G:T-mismatch repair DNA endonuclease (very short patch repair protein)
MVDRDNKGRFLKGFKHPRERINLDSKLLKEEYINNEKSAYDIGKKYNVSEKTIRNRLVEIGVKLRDRAEPTKNTREKIKQTNIRKGIKPKERYSGQPTKGCFKKGRDSWNKGLVGVQESEKKGKKFEELYGDKADNIKSLIKIGRAKQITPKKDTSIEIKIQNFLKQLNIDFLTHQYIKDIEHGYQCDILIPVQEGIYKKTIIECFGTYWHNYPLGREVDIKRCNELREQGFRVLVFWENEINVMELNNLQEVLIK